MIFKLNTLPLVINWLMCLLKACTTSHFLFLWSKIMVSIDPMVFRGDVKESNETGKQRLKLEEEEDQQLVSNG